MRSAKARAASTNWVSLSSTRAWSGVVVDGRAIVQISRLGASKATMLGGGDGAFPIRVERAAVEFFAVVLHEVWAVAGVLP